MTNTKKTTKTVQEVIDLTKKTTKTPKVTQEVDVLKGLVLPEPTQPKVPQHLICLELAKKGYKSRQVSEITGISYNNVAWYFSKYKLNAIADEFLKTLVK